MNFLQFSKRTYSIIREALNNIPDLTFRRVPETGVENYSFLSFFLPTKVLAKKAQLALTEAGVDGCFYWFDNNWHYHTKWEHLKKLTSLGPMSKEISEGLPDYQETDFSQSDHWVGRNISCLIKLSWSSEEVNRGQIKWWKY